MADFYDSTYQNFSADVYGEVRAEVFGKDLGQNSWLTAEEHEAFLRRLQLARESRVLDVACGSGGPAVRLAESAGCSVRGIDLHAGGIAEANALAVSSGCEDRVQFDTVDAAKPLPYKRESFDAVLCIDAIHHFPDHRLTLSDWARVMAPGGKLLFTNPLVVTGPLSHKEVAARSLIGFFLFVPPGEDERHIREAGLELILAEDVTPNVSQLANRWLRARNERQDTLRELEGADSFDNFQEFLETVELLAGERRLSRFVFVARKPA